MALNKTLTALYQFKQNATSPSSVSFTSIPVVQNFLLVTGHNVTNPGVFTAGTPSEGYTTHVTNDSNS